MIKLGLSFFLASALSLDVQAGEDSRVSRRLRSNPNKIPCAEAGLGLDDPLQFKPEFLQFRGVTNPTQNLELATFPAMPCGKDPRDGVAGNHECYYYPGDNAYECEASPTKAKDFAEFATGDNGSGTPFFENEDQLCVVNGYTLQKLSTWYWVCKLDP